MVYNDMVYRPAAFSDKLREKLGMRSASDKFKTRLEGVGNQYQSGELMSFFGRSGAQNTNSRSVPRPAANKGRTVTQQRTGVNSAPADLAKRRKSAAGGIKTARAYDTRNAARDRAYDSAGVRQAPRAGAVRNTGTTSFDRAYAAGARVRRKIYEYSSEPRKRYAYGAYPSGALRRGRSNIPGSRHAVLITNDVETRRKPKALGTAARGRHIAEHRLKREPFPLGLVTMFAICTAMVMLILYSFSQIQEYNDGINELKARQRELQDQASKLELSIEKRDDIRNIEMIATEEIGMVSSDMAKSKYISVSAPDRVEVMAEEESGGDGVFSSLLSVIGETFGRLGEYFG